MKRTRRARKIQSSRVKNFSKFPSLKKGEPIYCESLLECDFCYLAEIDPDVLYYCEQPFTVIYYRDGKEYRYTPDFYLKKKDGNYIVEVKPKEKADSKEWKELFDIVAPILEEGGYTFVVVTDVEIRREPRLTNVKILSRYWRIMVTHQHQAVAQAFLRKSGSAYFNDVRQFLIKKGIPVEVLYALIYWGILSIDITKPLNSRSILSLPGYGA